MTIDPALTLDSPTLAFASAAISLAMAGIAWSAARATPRYRDALRAWMLAMLAASASMLMVFLRGHVHWLLGFALANLLLLLAPALELLAQARLIGARLPLRAAFALAGLTTALALAGFAMGAPAARALGQMSAIGALELGLSAWLLGRHALATGSSGAMVGALSAGLLAATCLLRMLGFMLAGPALAGLPQAPVGGMLIVVVVIASSSIGFFVMLHERQRHDSVEVLQRDGLTGVLTRSAFFERAQALHARAHAGTDALVMLDIDHFKRINDAHGHAAGDVTLAVAARAITAAVRPGDLVGRYGGEEFCLLLPDCGGAEAAALAERLVSDARHQRVRLPDGTVLGYTLSAGHALCAPAAWGNREPLTQAIERADRALFLAKRQGRDRAQSSELRVA
jgi:diguanylate cyclase (GGDEF)-like protein